MRTSPDIEELLKVHALFRSGEQNVLHSRVHLDNLVKVGETHGDDIYRVVIEKQPAFISLRTLALWAKQIIK